MEIFCKRFKVPRDVSIEMNNFFELGDQGILQSSRQPPGKYHHFSKETLKFTYELKVMFSNPNRVSEPEMLTSMGTLTLLCVVFSGKPANSAGYSTCSPNLKLHTCLVLFMFKIYCDWYLQ